MQGWLAPAQAAVEFSQCLVRAIRPELRCPKIGEAKKKVAGGQSMVEIMQLPALSEELVRNLERKHKIKTLSELVALPEDQRDSA